MHSLFLSKAQRILFPLSLVLFEFSVYIANDMIQPTMLAVVTNFHVGIEWVPASMTVYLAGGACLQWLFGPLSDQCGRRPIMLMGVFFFIITCLIILLVSSIQQFIILRFLQGIGLGFIGAVGYATIQETFEEAQCVKIIALMANIALIAPLLGPLAGASLINILSWQGMFIIFVILSVIALVGLWFFMPETIRLKGKALSFYTLWHNYKYVLKNKRFIYGAIAKGCADTPLLAWIALSPLIIISGEKLSTITYALLQIPVFGGLIAGNLLLSRFTGITSLLQLIKYGGNPMITGLILAGISTFFPLTDYLWIIAGLSLYSFGLGITNACLTRLTLFSSNISKGTVSASMGIISMIVFTIGIEISKITYFWGNKNGFNLFNLLSGGLWLILVIIFVRISPKESIILHDSK